MNLSGVATAQWLTLFHPATEPARVKGITHSPNTVLHPWLQAELAVIVAALVPCNEAPNAAANRATWVCWQDGPSVRFTLLEALPPLWLLRILDHLAGHKSTAFVCWLMAHGIMPLYAPLGGSGSNKAESIQRILVGRALSGPHPGSPRGSWLGWRRWGAAGMLPQNPFDWGGKHAVRRQ